VIDQLNRAFMYGESVFTTLRVLNGIPQDWNLHFDRLRKGVEFMYGPFTDGDDWVTLFRNRVETKFSNLNGDKVLRITVYRDAVRGLLRGSLVSISDIKIHFLETPFTPERITGKPLKLRTCSVSMRPSWWPSYLKAGNYLETILSQKVYLKPEDDDLLFLSPDELVLESSVANIFIVRHDKLYTPPLGPNVLDGVMRKKVIQAAPDHFANVEESSTTREQLIKADAVFGSNSVRGLFLVDRIDDYEISYSQEFMDKFEKLKSAVMS
jgi:4-amino-4-deoxychorismate lyase